MLKAQLFKQKFRKTDGKNIVDDGGLDLRNGGFAMKLPIGSMVSKSLVSLDQQLTER